MLCKILTRPEPLLLLLLLLLLELVSSLVSSDWFRGAKKSPAGAGLGKHGFLTAGRGLAWLAPPCRHPCVPRTCHQACAARHTMCRMHRRPLRFLSLP